MKEEFSWASVSRRMLALNRECLYPQTNQPLALNSV